MEKAIFAAGCFWGVESKFASLDGVVSTRTGYCGGDVSNPTYEEVCSDTTGHAESVEVTFDPEKISYERLLDAFWSFHNPTHINRQGVDEGSQYRSIIFYNSQDQKELAEQSKDELSRSNKYNKPIATQIMPESEFYPAEEYHQHYYAKRGSNFTCES